MLDPGERERRREHEMSLYCKLIIALIKCQCKHKVINWLARTYGATGCHHGQIVYVQCPLVDAIYRYTCEPERDSKISSFLSIHPSTGTIKSKPI